MRIQKNLVAVLFVCEILLSCASTPEKKIDSAYVMVYDRENSEVMGASVFVDGELIGSTDIYGRFMFPVNKADDKSHVIRIEKEGHETVSMETALRPGQLLYFRIGTGAYYAALAEEFLDRSEEEKAIEMIDHALDIESRKDWLFLKNIIFERMNK